MLPVKIEICNFGKIQREYRQIVNEYEMRISNMARFRRCDGAKLPQDAILLDPRGVEMDSEEFYRLIYEYSKNGRKIVFAVGPPEGFSDENRKGHMLLSLSKLTLRHELAYLVLLEQIYRALLKMKGTNYEK